MFVTVTSSVYGSPAVTTSGWVNVSVNRGLRTSTAPAARPRTSTGPTGRPFSVALISISTTWLPSRRPSTRYSALPESPGPIDPMSSPVPSLPSGPGCTTIRMRWDSPCAVCAMRSGSSGVPTTWSRPGGSTISAVTSVTTRFDPSGAAFPTISSTLKYWLRKPMSPGITITPGIGGTTRLFPCSPGAVKVNPMTLRLGICVCSFSVSGMIVFSCGSGGALICGSCAWPTCTSCAPCKRGSSTGKLRSIVRSSIANAAEKLYAWKFD